MTIFQRQNEPTLRHILQTLTRHFRDTEERAELAALDAGLTSVTVDSREAQTGTLFVALEGDRVDGHDFVLDAFDRGAIAAIVEQDLNSEHALIDLRDQDSRGVKGEKTWDGTLPITFLVDDSLEALHTCSKAWRDKLKVRVVGITGSVGKSSTKELTYSVLSQRYRTMKSPGNRNSVLGLPPALFDLRPEHEFAVLEMGMYTTGEIEKLCDITRPEIGVLTMIGPVHLERAGTMEAIVAAKRELIESLPSHGVAILNRDDDRVMDMAGYTDARVFTYGLNDRADLWADNIHSMGLGGIRFTLHAGNEALSLSVPMLGRHSVHTALRATAVGLVANLSWEEIVKGLSETDIVEFRLVAVPGPKHSIIIDDTYNSSPDSALAALNLLSELSGRRIAVLGDMLELGQAEEESHRLVGRRAADVADLLVTIGCRSRIISEEARRVGMATSNIFWVDRAEEAIPMLEQMINEQDIVLVKGSLGMRMDQIVSALSRDESASPLSG